jgi:hypothetical protein
VESLSISEKRGTFDCSDKIPIEVTSMKMAGIREVREYLPVRRSPQLNPDASGILLCSVLYL